MDSKKDNLDEAIRRMVAGTGGSAGPASPCPEEERLVLYLENRLNQTERDEMEKHLSACSRCLDVMTACVSLSAGEHPASLSAPREVMDRAKSISSAPSSLLHGWIVPFLRPIFRSRWSLAWAVPLIIVLLIPLAWITVQPSINKAVTNRVQKALRIPGLTIKGVEVNWRSVLLQGLVLSEGDTRVMSFGDADVEFKIRELLSGELVVSRMTVDAPYLSVGLKGPGGKTELGGVTEEFRTWLSDSPVRFESSRIVISDGSVDLVDEAAGPEPVRMAFREISLEASNFSYPEAGKALFKLDGRIQQKIEDGLVAIDGDFDSASGNFDVRLNTSRVDLGDLAPYYENRTAVDVTGGSVGAQLNLKYDGDVISVSGTVTLQDIVSKDKTGDFFGVAMPALLEGLAVRPDGISVPVKFSIPSNADRQVMLKTLLDNFQQGLVKQIAAGFTGS